MNIIINLADRKQTSAELPGVEILNQGHEPWLQINARQWPLWILERASKLPTSIGDAVPRGAVGLVLAEQIPQGERESLQAAGLAWWDLRGALHFDRDDVLVHIDRSRALRRSKRRIEGSALTGVLGPVGMRAAQVLAEGESSRRWTVSALAAEAGISMGQAHNVLNLMEEQKFVQTIGSGPSKRRVVEDRERLLEWMGVTESRLRVPKGVYSYLYASNEVQLMHRFHEAAERAGIAYAVTSSVGARFWRVPVTTSPVARIRVDATADDDLLDRLGLPVLDADEAGRGANLELWSDTGRVGVHGRRQLDGVYVSSESRVWLDLMRQGGRYADGAELMKERILERQ